MMTAAQQARILKLYEERTSIIKIAKIVGRSENSVRGVLRRSAIKRNGYRAQTEEAQYAENLRVADAIWQTQLAGAVFHSLNIPPQPFDTRYVLTPEEARQI